MTQPDAVMTRVGDAIALSQNGDREAARATFGQLWSEVGVGGDPLHRCAVAHWMADLQDDPQEELTWDLRALEAADSVTGERVLEAGLTSPVTALYPSLHLNIAEAYRKLGAVARARHHLALGRAAADALPDDGYGRMIRGGLDRLAERLDA
ncbi:MAG TPA: hypothetical protein VGN47_16055 [Blastococcus sp.]|jgi:hypothetical protein|nr:hypothetical protein [Blastococcus sp.]